MGVILCFTFAITIISWIYVGYSVSSVHEWKFLYIFFLIAGALGTAATSRNLYLHVFGKSPTTIEDDPDFLDLLTRIRGTTPLSREGAERRDFVVRDAEYDIWLRANDYVLLENKSAWHELLQRLRASADEFERMLRTAFWTARNKNKQLRRQFSDDKKVCLYSTPNKKSSELLYFIGSYYASYLTNEFCGKLLASAGPNPSLIRRGSQWFPLDQLELRSLENSKMGNHIGIATIGFTTDQMLAFWRQNARAMVAEGLIVCTGGGSLDEDDLDHDLSLHRTIQNGMERELREESSERGAEFKVDPVIETRVTGFYRWLNRGGKPEFVGVTKLSVASHELRPNDAEVDAPEWIQLRYPARNLRELKQSLQLLLEARNTSVSAWMAITCFKEAIEEDKGSWIRFLEIGE